MKKAVVKKAVMKKAVVKKVEQYGDGRDAVRQAPDEAEFERRLGALLDGYAGELPGPGEDLVTGGMVRGRRMRVRRRALWGAATVVCAGVVAGGAALGAGPRGGPAAQADGVTIPVFEPVAAASGPPAGTRPLTGEEAVTTLRGLLPGAPATTGQRGWQGPREAARADAGGRLLVAGAEVAVSVQGNVQLTAVEALGKDAARAAAEEAGRQDKSGTAAPDKEAARDASGKGAKASGKGAKKVRPVTRAELRAFYSCAARAAPGITVSGCDARNLADDAVLITYEEHEGRLVRRTADLLRKDGTRIVVTTANAADAERGPASTATPPLTTAELARVAQAGAWQPWVKP
ncbi:hypothetical protein ACIREE_06260 [Streptomyces sp. NPDC102467]|uniref:hypothetical protein n=1 Tax=Streptomyces sp. NPDC102467 TaxID=3366179 RepID=UPI0038125283